MRQPFYGRIAALTAAPARKCKRRAFTLIELLVVVAIIALLVSLLLPALAEATKLARISVCETNLHYIGLGLNLYADAEGEGDFPIGRWSYAWEVYQLTRDGVADAMAGRIGVGRLYPDYISDAHIYYCPAMSLLGWSFDAPYAFADNWPIVNNPPSWTGQITGIQSGRLYGECNTTLAPYRKPYSRELFTNRAIVADVFTLGLAMTGHELGLPVLRGDGSAFLYQDTIMDDMIGPEGTPLHSGTALAHWWWNELTGHN